MDMAYLDRLEKVVLCPQTEVINELG